MQITVSCPECDASNFTGVDCELCGKVRALRRYRANQDALMATIGLVLGVHHE